MRMIVLALVLAEFLTAFSCFPAAGASAITLEEVEAAFKQNPKATLEMYFSCEKYEGSAYERIASGAPEWISLAEKMLQYSDACYTEGIQASLGEAMRKSHRNVLKLVNKTPLLSAENICLPSISAEQSIDAQLQELEISKNVIQSVHDRDLVKQRAACLRVIQTLEEGLIRQRSRKRRNSNVE